MSNITILHNITIVSLFISFGTHGWWDKQGNVCSREWSHSRGLNFHHLGSRPIFDALIS